MEQPADGIVVIGHAELAMHQGPDALLRPQVGAKPMGEGALGQEREESRFLPWRESAGASRDRLRRERAGVARAVPSPQGHPGTPEPTTDGVGWGASIE